MLTRLLDKALVKLEIKDSPKQTSARADEALYPTLFFPPPPQGTTSLCRRCLTLLSHFISRFGDGTDYQPLTITHSWSIRDLTHAVQMNHAVARKNTTECVICIKVFILFKAMQAHVSFEDSWRTSPSTDWNLTWAITLPNYEPNKDRLHVKFSVTHKGGYSWGIGGFKVYPDRNATAARAPENPNKVDDTLLVGPLDGYEQPTDGISNLDFSSTLSQGTLALVSSWARECATSHAKCRRIFGSDGLQQPEPWFPDRLVQVRRKDNGSLTARLVLKANPAHFPTSASKHVDYLSFSHCWGPPPEPNAPLGGRAGSVLTRDTLSKWTAALPVNDLPLAFRHAITVCAWLDFEYIWIDSLCIMQDSREDWEIQSAVMGDVYKFAFLNIAALSSTSDYNGFIFSRDTRIVFGFRRSFANLLGRNASERNQEGKQCVLLKGQAPLVWDFQKDIQGSTDSNTPLFTRAWVYQERSLARRSLAFSNSSVYWSCDEHSVCEQSGWGGYMQNGLRRTLHRVEEIMSTISQNGATEDLAKSLIQAFDYQWHSTVTNYSNCSLTKHTDKLVAVSSVARELDSTGILQSQRYLAGLWSVSILIQMSWITIVGSKTPARKVVGEEGYVAPSWSWASVEACVQPRHFWTVTSATTIPLGEVLGADVELATDYKFGSVKAGWIRVRGHLNGVQSGSRDGKSLSLTDRETGGDLWFCSDTVEGFDIVRHGNARRLVWMPLSVSFDTSISGKCLVLLEVPGQQYGGPNAFIRPGEKVYRRMGTGRFGRTIGMLHPTDVVLGLGTYPNIKIGGETRTGAELASVFTRKQTPMEEFVLI
ncbi:HET domain protein pin-c1 [Drepanopeziza brunnea f. sp. 'multigermtubi' MB_m1]|uniref:HET domain protein pin-c1 n=1 Tax=Marssonina brunnea f. sp. multigermtubi (strain MB_m1) TaxID=1072389 RepID=K1X6U4_MARBU|nr:HET domain protein pin-c1 [Drepanopeziza brunnea f. sp. 'multigermtubi' MB_m1]EKD20822.1 HET domain protein pin-c1 [Drepanopeziza brunnea f. sp. 'multigermtubi' MB_m1]